MKYHDKVGNREGNTTFRKQSQFKNRQSLELEQEKGKKNVPKKKP